MHAHVRKVSDLAPFNRIRDLLKRRSYTVGDLIDANLRPKLRLKLSNRRLDLKGNSLGCINRGILPSVYSRVANPSGFLGVDFRRRAAAYHRCRRERRGE